MAGNIINACTSPNDWLASWQVLSALGIVTSWFIVSLAYMVGNFLDNIGLMARAKSEIWEIITTTLILGSVLVIVSTACTFPGSYINPALTSDSGNLFKVAENYLFWLRNATMATFKDLMTMNNSISKKLSMMGGVGYFGIGLSAQPFAGLQPLMNILNLFMNAVMICLIITIAQITILKFIEAGAFSVLLPVGIVCRSFPFTRQFGGSLIAISIGLFIFYPLMLVVDDAIMGSPSLNPANISVINSEHVEAGEPRDVASSMAAAGGTGAALGVVDLVIAYFVNKPVTGLGGIALAALILPAINGVVFVAVVRDLSRALGQEVDVTSLTRVI